MSTATVLDRHDADRHDADQHAVDRHAVDRHPVEPAWITATVRPAGSFGRGDVGRLRALLDALCACASIVVLDLQAARLISPRAASAIDEAAHRLEEHGGCLLCINVDAASRACLSTAGPHAVLLAHG